jgi:hypothetical protein
MAYHITLVVNNSDRSIAITNPVYEADSKLVLPQQKYTPQRPILIDTMAGNPTYVEAAAKANNIYTKADNYGCVPPFTHSVVSRAVQLMMPTVS